MDDYLTLLMASLAFSGWVVGCGVVFKIATIIAYVGEGLTERFKGSGMVGPIFWVCGALAWSGFYWLTIIKIAEL